LGRLDDGSGNFLAYYDDLLGITLLTDANLAASMDFGVSGIGVAGFDGRMNANTAVTWLGEMNAYNSGAGYLDINTWRAPLTGPIDGLSYDATGAANQHYDGTTDIGYNISAPGTLYAGSTASEMAYLYYNTLGNLAPYDTDGSGQVYKPQNWGSFENVQLHRYISGSEYDATNVFGFSMNVGQQRLLPKDGTTESTTGFVWAVATGDVAALTVPVPLPAAIWLFATGLLSMAGVARRKRKAG